MAYPNLRQSIWLLFLLMLAFVVLALAAAISGWQFEDDFALGTLSLVSFAVILGYVYRRTDLNWEYVRRLFNRDFDLRVWPCVAISVVGLGMLDSELMKVVISIVPMPEWMQEVYRSGILSRTSFLSALFGHALNNLIAVTILHFYTRHLDISGDINEVAFNPWWWSVSGIALTALGLWWFYRVSKETQPISEDQEPHVEPRLDAV